jgi:hypothetical protein
LPPAKPGGRAGLESIHHATPPPTAATTAREMKISFFDIEIYPAGFDGTERPGVANSIGADSPQAR